MYVKLGRGGLEFSFVENKRIQIGVAKADRIQNGGFKITMEAVVLTEWPVLFTTPAVLFSQHPIATRSGLRGPNGLPGAEYEARGPAINVLVQCN